MSSKKISHKGETIPANVVNKDLYIKVRKKVKRRVSVWPSAYASGQVVSEYKKAGGKYKGRKSVSNAPLDRWYREKWVNVCKPKGKNSYVKCGRKKSSIRKYPYCRPSIRVNNSTPTTVGELKKRYGKKKLDELCKRKRKTALPRKGRAVQIKSKETKKKRSKRSKRSKKN